MRFYIAIAMILLLSASGAEAVELRARLESPEIPFHRTARFVVEVETDKEIEPRIGEIENGPELLEFKQVGFESLSLDDTHKLVRQTWQVYSPMVGLYRIPPVTVSWGSGDSATTEPVVLRVRDLKEAERNAAENFVDIETPEPLSTAAGTTLRWGGALALVCVLLGALLWFLLRKKEEVVAQPPKPWEVADKRLAELSRRKLPEQGAIDQYYVDLSAILRYYLEDRFSLHAPDLTTQELLEDVVENKVLNEKQQEFLASFLRHCDYVKFAQYRPSSDEISGGFSTVRQFVHETIPTVETPTKSEAA